MLTLLMVAFMRYFLSRLLISQEDVIQSLADIVDAIDKRCVVSCCLSALKSM